MHGRRVIKRIFLFAAIMLVLFTVSFQSFAEGVSIQKIGITQAYVQPDDIRVYLDVYDADGKNAEALENEKISAMLGDKQLQIDSVQRFDNSGEAAAYVFLVDISRSLDSNQNTKMRQVLNEIMEKTGKDDKIALATFGNDVNTVLDFTADKAVLEEKINGIQVKDDNTNLYRGVVKALEMLSAKNAGLPSKRAVVIVSDGEESHDGGITKDEVYMKIKETHIPIYTISFYNQKASERNKEYEKILGSYARTSLGQDYSLGMDGTTVGSIAASFQTRIGKSFVMLFSRSGIKGDGQNLYLKINYRQDDKNTLETSLDLRIDVPEAVESADATEAATAETAQTVEEETFWDWVSDYKLYIIVIGGALVILTILTVLLVKSINKSKRTAGDMDGDSREISFSEDEGHTKPLPDMPGFDARPAAPVKNSAFAGQKGVRVRLTRLGRNEEDKSYEFDLQESVIIGRNPSRAKLLFREDEKLSGTHCELSLKDNMIFITDLNSTNGTYVNGVPINGYYRLRSDDIVLIGSMEFRINF